MELKLESNLFISAFMVDVPFACILSFLTTLYYPLFCLLCVCAHTRTHAHTHVPALLIFLCFRLGSAFEGQHVDFFSFLHWGELINI